MITKFSTEITRFFLQKKTLKDYYFNDVLPGKKKFSRDLQLFLILCFISFSAKTQTFHTVPNPTSTGSFQILGAGGALSGYAGTPITLNNSLVLEYNASNVNQNYFAGTQTTIQLATYDGGDSLHLIPNPDGGLGVYFQNVQMVYNDTLYFGYINSSGILQLATFDGNSIKLYPNPDASANGEAGSFRVFRNSLYGLYLNAAGVFQFAKVTPSGLLLIPNPDNSTYGFVQDFAVIFNDRICSRYVNAAGVAVLATYDGSSWTMWPNPDNSTFGYQPLFPVIYHNKLCIQYYIGNQFQLMEWDGTHNPVLIPNPQNSSINNGGFVGDPIVYNDTLFFKYYSTDYTNQLAKFDGTSITLVPSPQQFNYYNGFMNSPIIYNNNLYLNYRSLDGNDHLAQYETGSDSLDFFPNPDGANGYQGQPIIYNNNLYFQYLNASNVLQLGYFNGGSSLNLLSNPAGAYNSVGSNGYAGYPFIWNNLLYLQFEGIPYGNAGNLVSFSSGALPVTFTSFNGKLNGDEAILSWNTASEFNNKGFEIEKSEDGQNFADIGFVAGHGTSSLMNTYNFTDMKVLSGHNYYRLKQVDIDGNFTYSSIIRLDFSQFSWNIFANPISANSWIQLQLVNKSNIVLQVYTADGKLLQTINKETLSPGTYGVPLNLGNTTSGIYVVKLVSGNQVFSKEVVK